MIDLNFFVDQGIVFAQENFFSPAEIDDLHRQIAQLDVKMAPVFRDNGGQQLNTHDRKTEQFDTPQALRHFVADRLYLLKNRFESFFQVQLSGTEPPGFLRYLPGYFFRPHRDWQPELTANPNLSDRSPRQVSVIILLSTHVQANPGPGAYSGGDLVFYLPTQALKHKLIGMPLSPPVGTLIAFRSDLTHEVKPILAGERLSIVSWLY
jgi:SM-20-related protein